MAGSAAARRWRMSQVPSVERSSTTINSLSMFSGKGAASTCGQTALNHRALVVDGDQDRELHANSPVYMQHPWPVAFSPCCS